MDELSATKCFKHMPQKVHPMAPLLINIAHCLLHIPFLLALFIYLFVFLSLFTFLVAQRYTSLLASGYELAEFLR